MSGAGMVTSIRPNLGQKAEDSDQAPTKPSSAQTRAVSQAPQPPSTPIKNGARGSQQDSRKL